MVLSPEHHFLLNLAIAWEALVAESELTMPPGSKVQRMHMTQEVERQIDAGLRQLASPLPKNPDSLDPAFSAAWGYLVDRGQLPPPAPPNLTPYEHLKRSFSEHSDLGLTAALLEWILRTKTDIGLPEPALMEAKSAIEVCMHRVLNRLEIPAWLEQALTAKSTLDETEQRNLALMEHQLREAQGIDEGLVARLSEAESTGQHVWEIAKPKGDFAAWLPHLETMVGLVQEKGARLGKMFGVSPYQALLGSTSHNPGLHNEMVNTLFAELRAKLPDLITRVTAKQAKEAPAIPLPDVPILDQQRLARLVMNVLGLDEKFSRLDISAHPFSTGEWDDVRITTRYREDNLLPALMGVIHETGHAFYSHALPRVTKGQPVGAAQSMWVHESQSLFWENQIASSFEFMEFLAPLIRKELGVDGPAWTAENFYKLVTRVHPGFIRVDADEVTYPAHVILRHDLEQRLVAGTLLPKDLPAAWNAGMKELLGVDVPNPTLGCMQDVHWPGGSFGYFPAYTFGAVGAAHLMQALRREHPSVSDDIRSGNFKPIRDWLAEKIHSKGSYYDGETLFEKATGEKLSANAFFAHLESRYLET